MWIDTHCHLTSPEYAGHVPDVLARAHAAGVTHAILVATNPDDADAAFALAAAHDNLAVVAGIHPHEAARWDNDALDRVREHARRSSGPRLVGVGETGLDFHYDFAPRDRQEAVFRAHLALAQECNLPVIIHARESEDRVCDILAEYPALAGRVVFHCFSGDRRLLSRVLDLGHWVSFTGVVTFRKATDIQDSARAVPLERVMLETDAPYLSPEPHRKVRPNEPSLLPRTGEFIAGLRNLPPADFAARTSANTRRFFRWPEE